MSASTASGDGPVLLLCAHGSRSPAAQRATARVARETARRLPRTAVLETWVDVQSPDVARRCEQFARRPVVIVPLLLAAGYHVHQDLRRAVAGRARHVITGALGPDPRLSALLLRRLAQAGPEEGAAPDPIVLIAAGSSDERAVADVRAQAADLQRRSGRRVRTGFISAAQPSAEEAVESLRARSGRPVAAASFLLSPGVFQDRAEQAGADVLSAPLLGEDTIAEEVIEIVLERWQEGLRRLTEAGGAQSSV